MTCVVDELVYPVATLQEVDIEAPLIEEDGVPLDAGESCAAIRDATWAHAGVGGEKQHTRRHPSDFEQCSASHA